MRAFQGWKYLVAGFCLIGAVPALASPPSMGAVPAQGVYINSNGSPLLPLLNNARDSIDIEIYTMGSQTVRDLIRAALKRGVKVRILKDPNPLGDKCDAFGSGSSLTGFAAADCDDQQQLVADVRSAGGIYEPFNKQALCPNGGGTSGTKCYEHGKIALVDGVALVSTGNFDATNLCIDKATRCDRDYTLIENDQDIFQALESIFEADLAGQPYDVLSMIPDKLQGVLTVSPDSLKPIVAFIQTARESIDLETQYLEDPDVNSALEDAAKRGVKVSVTVASACAFGTPTASSQRKFTTTYGGFAREGISAAFFNKSNKVGGKAGYLHAKVLVIDQTRAWLGSENGSAESLTENREYGVIFDDAAWVKTVYDQITADHDSPDSETLDESLACAKDR